MQKTTKLDQYVLPIEVKKDGSSWYLASCPRWLDCYAQGRDPQDAIEEISQVAKTLIEIYDEEGKKVPLKKIPPRTSKDKLKLNTTVLVSSN